ncbi:hypothetical protein CONPUDRAFT_140195 [Coniophora puteana RWD-64-598 SS2]|uniref:Zn(2)-C6 fungal-type domain-containing protein n=1 Tax=Coniophora puteana (strain RWD-64-598) TaxID=741705 RepID=A0A5M3M8P8_CONPW|nr:uncharacterized protein CONPUDRAFT_140195 [Coniophora puteana RWD-64-598 SS2]EIW75306.1 hypothetical protein CONPUDRAFT_140195 [Coniophora puteana RWD-64-598 SS2]
MPPEPTRAKAKRKATRKEEETAYRFDGGHSREIEQKRNAGQISCAECRRLKIKCDKQIPCQSCQRRGCAALCPNGSLATGQGTRFVLAATEHFHRRITKMSDRIRLLEDALASLQSQHSSEPHPLLRDDLLGVNQRDDEAALAAGAEGLLEGFVQPADIIDSFGTLSITDRGVSRFFGPTGGTEALLMSDGPHSESNSPAQTPESGTGVAPSDHRGSSAGSSESPPANKMFSVSFPFTPVGPRATVQELIESHLPPWDKAEHLLRLYFDNAAWLFHDVSKDQVMKELVPAFYDPGSKDDSSGGSAQLARPNEDHCGPHGLCVLFLLFGIGALVDLECSAISPEAEHFHQIARAALCIQPVLEKPSLVTIQALHLLSVYNAMSGNELAGEDTSNETTWSLITLAAHLSQTVSASLHRDSARWNLSPDIVNQRRTLFWDLFVADSWHSLNTGRPPTFSLAYIDCRFPISEIKSEEGESLPPREYESWGYRFACECVAEVAARTLTAEAPSYSTIMELDRKVREFPVSPAAEALVAQANAASPAMVPEERPLSIAESMGLFAMANSREVILLYIHRSFFAQAIIENPVNPLKSAYAASFLAAYRASTTTLHTIQAQFRKHPILTARFWVVWSFAFSSAIVFGTIVTRGPKSPLAANALKELDDACVLFANAAPRCMRAAKALPFLTKLAEKAHHAMNMAQTGEVSSMECGQHWNVEEAENNDELAIFAGRTRVLNTKRRSVSAEPQPSLARSYSSSSLANTTTSMEQSHSQQYRNAEFLAPPPVVDASHSSGGWAAHEQSSRYTHDQAHHQEYPGNMLLPPHPSQQHQQTSYQQAQPPLRQSTYPFPANERISHPQPVQIPQVPQLSLSTRELPLPHAQPHTHAHPHASQPRPHTHHQHPPLPQPSHLAGPSEMGYRSQQHDLASHRYPQQHQQIAAHPHSSYHPAPDSHGMYDRSRAQYDHSPAPSAHSMHSLQGHHGHGFGNPAASHPTSGSTSGVPAPPDLVGLGMASEESRLDERWTSFMRNEGYFDGYSYRGR